MASDETAEAILVAHQRQRGGCLCGWAELGKSHPGHQVAMLRKAGLIAELLDPAFVRQAEYVADFLVRQVNEEVRHG